MKYVPTDAMPDYYNLLDMIRAGLKPALAVDMLMFDRSLPLRMRVDEYDYINPVTAALLNLGWIKKKGSATYHIGQVFVFTGPGFDNGREFLLSQTTVRRVALICLDNGNRWCEPVEVESSDRITEKEFEQITNGKLFELVTK